MNKTIVKVFPDNLSTGLWINHVNVDESRFAYLPETVIIALKYWHAAWEFWIDDGRATQSFVDGWNYDGQKIVDVMNTYSHGEPYTFVYEVTAS